MINIKEKIKKWNTRLYKRIEKGLLGSGFSEIAYYGIIKIFITAVFVFILSMIYPLNILYKVAIAICIYLILLLIWIAGKFVIHRKALDYLFKIEKTPLKEYFREEIKRFYNITEKIMTDEVTMNQENVNMLTEALFKSGEGVYIGVESNLPSAYFKIYPKYLDHHAKYIENLTEAERREGKRILISKDVGRIL